MGPEPTTLEKLLSEIEDLESSGESERALERLERAFGEAEKPADPVDDGLPPLKPAYAHLFRPKQDWLPRLRNMKRRLLHRMGLSSQEKGDLPRMRGAFDAFLAADKEDRYAPNVRRLSALVGLERYAEAREEAEKILDDRGPSGTDYEMMVQPWTDKWLASCGVQWAEAQSSALDALTNGKRPETPWAGCWSGVLLCRRGIVKEGLAQIDRIREFPSKRYGWILWASGLHRLLLGEYTAAARDFRSAVHSRPDAWWARCRLAESLLCQGNIKEALRELSTAVSLTENPHARGNALCWKGEVLLWLGRYEEARKNLDDAVESGNTLALCWRGAARMLSGLPKEALGDLDRAVAADPGDREALVWRGEAKRRMGENRESLKDLDRAITLGSGTWAFVNRALAWAALGEKEKMRLDLKEVRAELAALLGDDAPKSKSESVRRLEKALTLARGVRRPETYLKPIMLHSL